MPFLLQCYAVFPHHGLMPKLSHFVLGWVAEQVTGIQVVLFLSTETRFIKEK